MWQPSPLLSYPGEKHPWRRQACVGFILDLAVQLINLSLLELKAHKHLRPCSVSRERNALPQQLWIYGGFSHESCSALQSSPYADKGTLLQREVDHGAKLPTRRRGQHPGH